MPWEWLAPLALALPTCLADSAPDHFQLDLPYFAAAGRRLLSAHWHATFASSRLQAGPLQLLVFGGASRLASLLGTTPGRLLAPLCELGIVALLVYAVGVAVPAGRVRRPAQLAAGVVAVLLADPSVVYLAGHPADAVTPLVWILAAREARTGRTGRAGLLLGLTAGLEVWGVLGMPVLLLAPRLRDAVRGAAVQGLVTVAPFVPFLVAGPFRMFDFQWQVRSNSLVGLVLAPGTPFPWTLRLAQGALALAAGVLVARVARGRAAAVCLVPLAVILVRLVLDPISGAGYYEVGLALVAMASAGAAAELALRVLPQARAVEA